MASGRKDPMKYLRPLLLLLVCNLQGAQITNELVRSYIAPERGWGNPEFEFPKFDDCFGTLQRIEVEYTATISAGPFVAANSTRNGEFVRIVFTNLFTLTLPGYSLRQGGFLFGCGYVPAQSSDVFISPPDPATTIHSFVLPISGNNLIPYIGVGTVKMPMAWLAGFDTFRRNVLDCSSGLTRVSGLSSGDTTFRLSAIVTLRYVYLPRALPGAFRIYAFAVNPIAKTVTLAWRGDGLVCHTFAVESRPSIVSGSWTGLRTVKAESNSVELNDLPLEQSGQNFYRIRLVQ